MKLDYTNMIQLIRIRKKQIEDAALENDKYNTEYTKLSEIEKLIAKLIVNDRCLKE